MAQECGDDASQRVLRATDGKALAQGWDSDYDSSRKFAGLETKLSDEPNALRPSRGDGCSAVSSWSQKELQKLRKRGLELVRTTAVAHPEIARRWDTVRRGPL